jgi:hypothetical protein
MSDLKQYFDEERWAFKRMVCESPIGTDILISKALKSILREENCFTRHLHQCN